MKTPVWETSSGALAAFLNSATQAYVADIFTITLSGGSVIRYTSADLPVTVNGNTYSIGPTITRGQVKTTVGINVDTLQVGFSCGSDVTYNGSPLMAFIANGGMDNARFVVERAYATGPGGTWVGVLGVFAGRMADVQASRYEAGFTINSDTDLLTVQIPRNTYSPGCLNTLFDAACTLSKASYAATATATGGLSVGNTVFSTGAISAGANYYAMGWAVCNTGANAGIGRTLRANSSNSLTTLQPWPNAVAAGDTFTIYPGCDKTQGTCATKFSNVIHFRGQPYVPAPETVV